MMNVSDLTLNPKALVCGPPLVYSAKAARPHTHIEHRSRTSQQVRSFRRHPTAHHIQEITPRLFGQLSTGHSAQSQTVQVAVEARHLCPIEKGFVLGDAGTTTAGRHEPGATNRVEVFGSKGKQWR